MRIFGSGFQKSSGVPWTSSWECVRCRRDGRHYVYFYGYCSVLGMSLPAVGEDSRLDHLFDDYGILKSSGSGQDFSHRSFFFLSRKNTLTPHAPSSCISLARLTRPYAPLPISRSITNSEMLRSVRKTFGSLLGVGAPTLATLRKLAALFERTSLVVAGGGEGGST